MPEVIYRSARAIDAPAIAGIHVISWRDAYRAVLDRAFLDGPIEEDRLRHWTHLLGTPSSERMVEVATLEGRPVGFVAVTRDHDPRWGSFVDNLHVLPELRGHRIGEILLRSAARKLASNRTTGGLYLWVMEINEGAVRFYRRLGGCIGDRGTSHIPAANGTPILRVYWPELLQLL